jgi:hypothetical protein
MPMPRHGLAGAVIGNRFHLVSGMIQSAGAMAMFDPKLEVHTAFHDVLELQFNPNPPKATASEAVIPPAGPKKISTRSTSEAGTPSAGQKKLYTLQHLSPRRPGDAREIRAAIGDHADVAGRRYPFMDLVVVYHRIKGPPAFLWIREQEGAAVIRHSCLMCWPSLGSVERLPAHPYKPLT